MYVEGDFMLQTVHTIFSIQYLKYIYEAIPAKTSEFFEITRE